MGRFGIAVSPSVEPSQVVPEQIVRSFDREGFGLAPMTERYKKGALWSKPEHIAHGIVKAVDKKMDIIYLLWQWKYLMRLIRIIPEGIFKRLSL